MKSICPKTDEGKKKEARAKYNKFQSKNLTDSYIKKLLYNSSHRLKSKYVTAQMIELKRELMQYKRLEKEIKNKFGI